MHSKINKILIMKKLSVLQVFLFFVIAIYAQDSWKPVGSKIVTQWAAKIDPANTLAEYPRPQMVREDWMNLNGLWQYTIIPRAGQSIPASFEGKILVPFAVESALSGVGK